MARASPGAAGPPPHSAAPVELRVPLGRGTGVCSAGGEGLLSPRGVPSGSHALVLQGQGRAGSADGSARSPAGAWSPSERSGDWGSPASLPPPAAPEAGAGAQEEGRACSHG